MNEQESWELVAEKYRRNFIATEARTEQAEQRAQAAETRVKELDEALRLMLVALPEGWTVPLLYSEIAAQCRAALSPQAPQEESRE